jgi:hypothetical protein
MTLIAFATYGDHAEFVTDSVRYTRTIQLGQCTKSLTMPHMDAAVLAQGNSHFGEAAKAGAVQASSQVSTFDELIESAQSWLTDVWQQVLTEDTPARVGNESVVFLIGWSDTEQEFTAYAFASEQGFKPVRVKSTWIMPSPWATRPSGLERRRMQGWMANHPDVDEAARLWALKPLAPRPNSVDEWVRVAKDARHQRSLSGGFAHVIVAGDVFHTRLGRGEITTRRVHRFADSGEEFAEMISGTQHPQAQMAACWCESGESYGDCHLAERYADGHTCDCGSGKVFSECCSVGARPQSNVGGGVFNVVP